MRIVPAQCPNCGAAIKVDGDVKKGICQFCETVFFIEEAIQTLNGKVEIDYQKKIDNYLSRAMDKYEDDQFDEAEKYCNMVLDLEADNADAKALLKKLKSKITKPNVIISCVNPVSTNPRADHVLVDGQMQNQTINPYGSLTLGVGTWSISIQTGLRTSSSVQVTINSNRDRYEIKYQVKLLKILIEVNKVK